MIQDYLKGKKVRISSSGTFRDIKGVVEDLGDGLILVKDEKGNKLALSLAQVGVIRIEEE